MRIASNQYHQTMSSALQAANTGLSTVMQQMASGQRVMKPSDDTIATIRLARMAREGAALHQYRDNISGLRTRLQTNEVTLDGMKQDLLLARDLMVWAADGTNTSADLQAMSGSLAALRDSLFFTINSKNAEGRYLFSGTATMVPTVELTGVVPGARYSSGVGINTVTQDVAVGDGVSLAANVSVAGITAFLNQLDDTVAKLGAGNASTASAQLSGIDQMLSTIAGQIGALGGRQTVLQTLEDNHDAVTLSNQQASISLGQLDYGEAAVRLNSYTQAVQATQKAYARVSSLSLFDAL
ncbi:flagellar hook-associated protein 3 [Paucibacter sediminis]|uniref:Flagellar hook-associated protein 3 n=1 Tax=Paucibacter sediminis TaxID=3019553 RepID=A0AA95NC61_9BURK|nr:flagellar hook-associated protein 3 [Paucibacter sp. S2-9]WIT11379.1 flagellar hook-associated protein 3 [Paucibacter sp. S2-9]